MDAAGLVTRTHLCSSYCPWRPPVDGSPTQALLCYPSVALHASRTRWRYARLVASVAVSLSALARHSRARPTTEGRGGTGGAAARRTRTERSDDGETGDEGGCCSSQRPHKMSHRIEEMRCATTMQSLSASHKVLSVARPLRRRLQTLRRRAGRHPLDARWTQRCSRRPRLWECRGGFWRYGATIRLRRKLVREHGSKRRSTGDAHLASIHHGNPSRPLGGCARARWRLRRLGGAYLYAGMHSIRRLRAGGLEVGAQSSSTWHADMRRRRGGCSRRPTPVLTSQAVDNLTPADGALTALCGLGARRAIGMPPCAERLDGKPRENVLWCRVTATYGSRRYARRVRIRV